MHRLPLDILREVGSLSDRPTQCYLALSCVDLAICIRPVLYCHICVGFTGLLLVRTLALHKHLALMLKSLHFSSTNGTDWPEVPGPLWDQALANMSNLTELAITQEIQFTAGSARAISFQLRSLAWLAYHSNSLADILSSQEHIEELIFHHCVFDDDISITPTFTPHLRTIKAPAPIAAALLPGCPVCNVWIDQDVSLFPRSSARTLGHGVQALTEGTAPLTHFRGKLAQLAAVQHNPSLSFPDLEELILDEDDHYSFDVPAHTQVDNTLWVLHRSQEKRHFPALIRPVLPSKSLAYPWGVHTVENVALMYDSLALLHFCSTTDCLIRRWISAHFFVEEKCPRHDSVDHFFK
ncbi:hypothetical protein FB451DRAFT_1402905 [Mycena latifolia]|nr:hypothetical protein FB451DRAFT_1402905 [Mycena latifolia]